MAPSSRRIRNIVRDKIARGETAYSMTVRLIRTAEIAMIAEAAGYDTLYIDLEHNSFSLDTTGQICMACLGTGVAPFVRVPSGDPHLIGRVLDGGALGIIAPHIQSVADAEAIVRAVKYPPFGDRSQGGSLPFFGFRSVPTAEANRQLNDATTVIAMIESPEALEAIDAIAAVPGIDILLIGTNDLCNGLGVSGQYDHEIVHRAYARGLDACRAHGKALGVGGLASRPDLVKHFVSLGARYVSGGADLSFLMTAAAQKRAQFG